MKTKLVWYPNVGVIESKQEIEPPNGAIILKDKDLIMYKELHFFSGYKSDGKAYEYWTGVECNGELENGKTIFLEGKEFSVCDLCRNQVKCIFNQTQKNEKFFLKKEYQKMERDTFNDWLHQNSKKYKVTTKNAYIYDETDIK